MSIIVFFVEAIGYGDGIVALQTVWTGDVFPLTGVSNNVGIVVFHVETRSLAGWRLNSDFDPSCEWEG